MKTLRIGGYRYTIEEVKELRSEADKPLHGQHVWSQSKILLQKELPQPQKEEILIHEVLHAIFISTGHKHNEQLIDAISNGLAQLGVGKYLYDKVT